MPRHSKNNTASGNFTYYERQRAGAVWGTASGRLSSLSQRAFDACTLCLSTARDPVCCPEGHLYCKECIYADLLAQRAEIERQKAALLQLAKQEEAERQRALLEAREKVLRDFERQSTGVGRTMSTQSTGGNELKRKADGPPDGADSREGSGIKKTLANFAERAQELAEEAEQKALAKIQADQATARKNRKLPSFWLPALTPNERQDAFALGIYNKDAKLEDMALGTVCKAATERGHSLSMKQLIEVKLQRPTPQRQGPPASGSPSSETSSVAANKDAGETGASCFSCKNALKQSTKIFVLRKCGHALCQACVDALVLAPVKLSTAKLMADAASSTTNGKGKKDEKESKKSVDASSEGEARCAVCDKKVKDPVKDVIRLQQEGTGFAASGNAEAKRSGTAFQA